MTAPMPRPPFLGFPLVIPATSEPRLVRDSRPGEAARDEPPAAAARQRGTRAGTAPDDGETAFGAEPSGNHRHKPAAYSLPNRLA